jgi:hypothetical protein
MKLAKSPKLRCVDSVDIDVDDPFPSLARASVATVHVALSKVFDPPYQFVCISGNTLSSLAHSH